MGRFKVREGQRLQDYMNFEDLTDAQKTVLQKYSRLRSASKSKREFSAVLKAHGGEDALVSDYVYDGMIDTGRYPGAYCSRKHKLRYVHFAVNKDNPDDVIKFGSTCVRDFFNISDAQMALIHQGVMEANKDIIQVIEKMIKYGDFAAYDVATDMWHKFNNIDSEVLPEAEQIKEFLINNLPLPDRLEAIINQFYFKAQVAKEYTDWLAANPKYKDIIQNAFILAEDDDFQAKHPRAHETMVSIVGNLKNKRDWTPNQERLASKILSTPWAELDPMVDGLNALRAAGKMWELNPNNPNKNAALYDILEFSYRDFGVTSDPNDPNKGQAGVIRRAYARYEAKINEPLEARNRAEAEELVNQMCQEENERFQLPVQEPEEEEWVAP